MPRQGKKDPNKPKGKKGAYIFFLEEERRNAGDKVEFTSFSKSCSDKWKNIEKEDKERFEKLAEKDKKRYLAEMAEYSPPTSDEESGGKKKRKQKKPKDPDQPKRNMSAYLHFSNAKRPSIKAEYPEATVGELAKHIADIWNNMKADEKCPYDLLASKDKERYLEAMKSYRATGGAKSKKAVEE